MVCDAEPDHVVVLESNGDDFSSVCGNEMVSVLNQFSIYLGLDL